MIKKITSPRMSEDFDILLLVNLLKGSKDYHVIKRHDASNAEVSE